MYEEQGYAGYFFENVKSVFEEDDLTIVNLEGTLTTATRARRIKLLHLKVTLHMWRFLQRAAWKR